MRVVAGCLLVFSVFVFVQPGAAQSTEQVYLTDWPAESPETDERSYSYELLPFIDTLAVAYQYAVIEDTPRLAFTVSWTPSPHAIYLEQAVRYADLPGEMVIEALELSAAVVTNGQTIGTLVLASDSLGLLPAPNEHTLTWTDISWAEVFAESSAATAQSAFASGFTLQDLTIERIAFASHERVPDRPITVAHRQPIYADILIDITFWDFWQTSGRAQYPPPRASQSGKPRGDATGRNARASTDRSRSGNRSTERSTSAKTNDDDEEEEDSLVPAAIVAAAAVGLVGLAGGTVGFYGTSETPIGLAAGFTRPYGGALLMAGINESVLRSGTGQKLTAKVLGFYDLLGGPVQPALSAGVLAQTDGNTTHIDPSVAIGGMLNVGPALLHLGYDPLQSGIEFSAAVNFRYFIKK